MLGAKSKNTTNKVPEMSKSRIRKPKLKSTKQGCIKTKKPVVNERITLPYNFLGNVTLLERVPKNNVADCTLKQNRKSPNESTSNNVRVEQTNYSSVSDYYTKLQNSNGTALNKSSIFNEINLRYQSITKVNNHKDFCQSFKNNVKFIKKYENRLSASVSKIKALVNYIDNDVEDDIIETFVTLTEDFDTYENNTEVPILCSPQQWVPCTPGNQRTRYPTIKKSIYEPFIMHNDTNNSVDGKLYFTKLPENHPVYLKRQHPMFAADPYDNIKRHNLYVKKQEMNYTNNTNHKNRNCTSTVTSDAYSNCDNFYVNENIELDESLIIPRIPDLREPSPLKFYPRKIFTSDHI